MRIIYNSLSIILPLALNLIFTPIIITIAHKNKLFDAKDHRKTHIGDIPRLGGIGFFCSIIVSAIIINILTKESVSVSFYIAISLIFISGVVDDFKPIRAFVKLIAQLAAGLTLIVGGHTLSHVLIPFTDTTIFFGYFQYPLTLLWVIGVTNAINLLDGMDGQAGGLSTIAATTLGIIALLLGQTHIAMACFILAGSLAGFLYFNLPPAKIFMGDSGSLTVGFFLATIPLLYSTPEIKGKMILAAVAVLLIPIFDVFAAMIRRTKLKQSFFSPDRGHIHHKFQDFTSLNTKQTLAVIYVITIISGTFATLFIIKTNTITQLGLFLNLIIHSVLFAFLHGRKKSRS
ncbi:MAG: undecaprenyl/decaprenyl-phosphate alpha-N-acetylglucosaminyl 1-phosphate transferase [Spirochaetaceae bacterium]